MSILKSDKAMLGAGLMFLILNVAILAPIATGAVPDAVAEATAEAPKDDICSNADCTEVEADWASSSTDRDFYGWNLTNLGEVLAGGELLEAGATAVESVFAAVVARTALEGTPTGGAPAAAAAAPGGGASAAGPPRALSSRPPGGRRPTGDRPRAAREA